MPIKDDVLQSVRQLATAGQLTKEEVLSQFDQTPVAADAAQLTKKLTIAEILYYVGAMVVILGITILISQNWATLNSIARILSTLGSGLLAYVIGLLLARQEKTATASNAFFLIFALVTPIGLYVTLGEANYNTALPAFETLVFGLLLAACLLSWQLLKRNIFILFSIIFGSLLFMSVTSWLASGSSYFNTPEFSCYQFFVLGISYLLLGNAFSRLNQSYWQGFLYNFGTIGVLLSTLILGSIDTNLSFFWQVVYPVLVFGAMFGSVYTKNKAMLVWGTIFLMVYILELTAKYFSVGLGWPLALVIAGLVLIAIAYISVTIRRRYLPA